MSYQKDLCELTDAVLKNELQRRYALRQHGNCSYCTRKVSDSKQEAKGGDKCKLHEWRDSATGLVFGPLLGN